MHELPQLVRTVKRLEQEVAELRKKPSTS